MQKVRAVHEERGLGDTSAQVGTSAGDLASRRPIRVMLGSWGDRPHATVGFGKPSPRTNSMAQPDVPDWTENTLPSGSQKSMPQGRSITNPPSSRTRASIALSAGK